MGLFDQNCKKHELSHIANREYLHTFKPFMYVHIPKTAGTSILRSGLISIGDWADHKIAKDIKNISKYYSFTFIRNPYDKVYSSYNYYLSGKHSEEEKRSYLRDNFPTFEEFILNYDTSKHVNNYHFNTTQKQYITNSNGDVIVDYVGDFYNVNKGFKKVQELNPINYGQVLNLPIENKTNKPIINVTDEMANIIYNHWREDFDFFNISKNSYK